MLTEGRPRRTSIEELAVGRRWWKVLVVAMSLGCPASPTATTSGRSGAAANQKHPPSPASLVTGTAAEPKPVRAPARSDWKDRAAGSTYPVAHRLVALGDLHGDLQATREALKIAGVIDTEDRWVGGTTTVV
ncbi:MAG: hypothetical protein ACPHRO_15150, partial [Nannocystaceae bacterium]